MEERPNEVFCEFRKWPDTPHWRMYLDLLGRDGHGSWFGRKPPLPVDGPQGPQEFTHTFVLLIPDNEWWIASYNAEPMDVEVYVDITTPAEWQSKTHVSAVDLDLDVIRRRTGEAFLDDEDEFEEHQVTLDYPDEVIEKALSTAKWLMEAVEQRREPFGAAGQPWLDQLRAD
jgi:hypothetical protein